MTAVYPYAHRYPSDSLQERRGVSALANPRHHPGGYSAPPPPPPFPSSTSGPRVHGTRQENMTIYNQSEPFQYELNRRYHGYLAGAYMYPNDEKEQDRLDILHKLYLVSRRSELHRAPITNSPYQTRILDLGTGTGIWSIDMADKYPDAEVIGTDLSPIQPKWIPKNLQIRICDFESTWTLGQNSFDLIHMRNGVGSVSNWPLLYRNVFQHLKPGYGWFEQVEIDYEPRCDDGTMAPNSHLVSWYQYLADATERSGKPLRYQHKTGKYLADAGFTDIREVIIQVPYSPWSSDPHLKKIGSWYTLAMSEGLESLCIAPFNRIFGWDLEAINSFLGPVKKEMLSKKVHAYNNMHIWTARRP